MSRQPPRQNPPPVQRLRIRYAKRGRLRFTSHRDFSRAFERAVARAGLPMAQSSGFNPHPRISYAGAAPTGSASEAEYLEIALAEPVTPDAARTALADALPDGLDVLEVVDAAGAPALADRLQASRWLIELDPALAAGFAAAVEAFLSADAVPVQRMTKKGMRDLDARAPVVDLVVVPAGLELVLRHQEPAVRPDDVVTGLVAVGALEVSDAPRLTRLAQGPLDPISGSIGDPLAGSPGV